MSARHIARRIAGRTVSKKSTSRRWTHEKKVTTSVDDLLATPTWSVSSLLPSPEQLAGEPAVSSKQLKHLLRLSALPPPKDEAEEAKMLKTLTSQLHFVKAIQSVDTTGTEPLRSIRDETTAGRKEAEIGLEALKDALAQEEVIGVYHKRIRRRRSDASVPRPEAWDVLGNAEKKVGRYFLVESGKD